MTYEPLHHKYRPQTFAELVGQEAIAQTLTSAILQERIAPAYLFTAPEAQVKPLVPEFSPNPSTVFLRLPPPPHPVANATFAKKLPEVRH